MVEHLVDLMAEHLVDLMAEHLVDRLVNMRVKRLAHLMGRCLVYSIMMVEHWVGLKGKSLGNHLVD